MAQSLNEPSTPSASEMRSAFRALRGIFSYALILVGIVVCGLVLVAYAVVAYQGPASRKHFDRISFRLLVGALVSNQIYGIALTLARMGNDKYHPSGCEFASFAANFGYLLGIFFTACIAVNSQLVLIHECNGKALEKYYVLFIVVLTLAICSSAYSFGQLGVPRIGELDGNKNIPRISTTVKLAQDPKYRRIIVRIALYPSVSVFLNFLGLSLDLYLSITEVGSPSQFRLLVLDIMLLGGRNIIYGAMAFGDPSFVSAVRDLSGEQSMLSTRGFNAMASRMINRAVLNALNLKETSSAGSTSNAAIESRYCTDGLAAEGSSFEQESEEFQRLKVQL
ncbi:hypothetical protein H0H92_007754 [Tricholoma furcatifolium]|nr:hypothetical protein H0H92_007754 [Tricholoma furcatifolium]